LKDDKFNIINSFNNTEYTLFRKLAIDNILATDMSKHFKLVAELDKLNIKLVELDENYDKEDTESSIEKIYINDKSNYYKLDNNEKSLLMQVIIHASDLNNPARTFITSITWAKRIINEFIEQGNKEKELNLQVSPMCDANE